MSASRWERWARVAIWTVAGLLISAAFPDLEWWRRGALYSAIALEAFAVAWTFKDDAS